jgi:hypothetical protein
METFWEGSGWLASNGLFVLLTSIFRLAIQRQVVADLNASVFRRSPFYNFIGSQPKRSTHVPLRCFPLSPSPTTILLVPVPLSHPLILALHLDLHSKRPSHSARPFNLRLPPRIASSSDGRRRKVLPRQGESRRGRGCWGSLGSWCLGSKEAGERTWGKRQDGWLDGWMDGSMIMLLTRLWDCR